MGDEEEAPKLYAYSGARATGEVVDVTAGEEPKVLTKPVELLGARHGAGEATFPNGDTYKGDFDGGARSGHGAYSYAAPPPTEEGEEQKPPVASYEGRWKEGHKQGVGVLSFTSGAKYHGMFNAGKYEGQGTMYYANGDIYTGSWSAGKKHGSGTYIFKESGAKVAGTWYNNAISNGTFTDKYGNAYDGSFAGDSSAVGYVGGGKFSLCSGAVNEFPKPTKEDLIAEINSYDTDGNGLIDAAELRNILCRPGGGNTAMSNEEAEVFLSILTECFDANGDGKLQVSEAATALANQY